MHEGLYVRQLDLADVTGPGPDSMVMSSSISSLCSWQEPCSLDSGWSKGLLGNKMPFSYAFRLIISVITQGWAEGEGTEQQA